MIIGNLMGSNAFEILRNRYIDLFNEEPASPDAIPYIEERLDLNLPEDVKIISGFYSGGFLGGISHYAIAKLCLADNVLQETERLRSSIALPNRFLVLAEPPESLIVLDCESLILKSPAVIWCDAHDVGNLNNFASLTKPEIWHSYSDFFAHLLEQEILERKHMGKRNIGR